MTDIRTHVLSAVPVAFAAVAVGHHPIVVIPLLAGLFLPEIDALDERFHRSWGTHTLLPPAVAYLIVKGLGVATPAVTTALHFVTLGMTLHLLADFVYPRQMTHEGAGWPVRPTVLSQPWGLIWLGASWALQWFLYIVPAFIPWLAGV